MKQRSAVGSILLLTLLVGCSQGSQHRVRSACFVVGDKRANVLVLDARPISSSGGRRIRIEAPGAEIETLRRLVEEEGGEGIAVEIDDVVILRTMRPQATEFGDSWFVLSGDFAYDQWFAHFTEPVGEIMLVGVVNYSGQTLTNVRVSYSGGYRDFGDVPTGGEWISTTSLMRFVPLSGSSIELEYSDPSGVVERFSHSCRYETHWRGQITARIVGPMDVRWEGAFAP